MSSLRLLYLGNAFPPGVSALFPELQPAGHLIETNLVQAARPEFDIRSVGIFSVNLETLPQPLAPSPGLPNALNLRDGHPALLTRWQSLRKLRRTYQHWLDAGWRPDVIVVCNFSPVYNAFIRRLARKRPRPRLVLYLADSTLLDVPLARGKRLRYRFKPFKWLDDEMAECYDACVAVSAETRERFERRGVPWLWLPNGIDPARVRHDAAGPDSGPIVFGYFGHAGEHTGVPHLLQRFAAKPRSARLKICCFGKARSELAARFGQAPNISFHGPFPPEGCVTFGTSCDVLVNPRPQAPGNRNNFPSKIFEYALAGRAVLSSQLSGADQILGAQAYYFDAQRYQATLEQMLDTLAATPRAELRERGRAVQQHLLANYQWSVQGQRLISFLQNLLGRAGGVAASARVHNHGVESLAVS